MRFGACAGAHLSASGGKIIINSSYSITGSATTNHYQVDLAGQLIVTNAITATLTGTPAFTAFANINNGSLLYATAVTYSGAATGTRYSVVNNAVANTNGGGASYFPGSVAGATSTGGQYV